LTALLTSCNYDFKDLDFVDIDPTVIAVTHLQGAEVGISQQRIYVLKGNYTIYRESGWFQVPPGICIDVGTYCLHRFDVEEFIKLYQSKLDPSHTVKVIG